MTSAYASLRLALIAIVSFAAFHNAVGYADGSDPADGTLQIARNDISESSEILRAGGFEITLDHPGIEHPRVRSVFEASQNIKRLEQCLEPPQDNAIFDLSLLSAESIHSLAEFEVCLQRIFSYFQGPSEAQAWLHAAGFEYVGNLSPLKLTYWGTVDQVEGHSLSVAWRNKATRAVPDYPLSGIFNSSADAQNSFNLSVNIKFNTSGEVFNLRSNLSLN